MASMRLQPAFVQLLLGAAALGLWTAIPTSALASSRELPPSATFSHLTIEQGLADQIATEITQDAHGFMWFGTFSGLDRYDGYRFVQYRHDDADPDSLSGNIISALYTDRTGTLWVGARGAGLNRFDPRTQRFEHFRHNPLDPNSVSSDAPHMIYQDASGTLWIASEGGLSRFNAESRTFTNYAHDDADPDSIGSNAVRSVAEDASGALWLGTAGGLSRFDPKSGAFTNYRHSDLDPRSLSANAIWKVVVDHRGLIWLATEFGLDSFDPESGRFTHFRHDPANPHSLAADPLDALLEDADGRLWVGTFGGGVSILDSDRQLFTNYQHDPGDAASLAYDQVDKLFRDRSGLIWLGTGGGGVDVYNPQQQAVTIYKPVNGLASPFVYTALADAADGSIWIGTRNAGLDRLDRSTGTVTHFPAQPGVPGRLGWPVIQDIEQDASGALWLAAYGGGVYRRDPVTGVFTEYRHRPGDPLSLSHDNARTLSFDENGYLWVATTGGGLNRLDPSTGTFTAYQANASDPHSLASNLTVGLDTDKHGGVWVGTSGDGLDRLDIATGQFTHYRHDPTNPASLSEDNVFAVRVDHAGIVWAGTQGGGLNSFDPLTGTFRQYHQKDGLPSERIQAIVEDGSAASHEPGNLWIVTDRGVARISPDRRTIRGYDAANGLPRAQFTSTASLDHNGELLIGNLGGLVDFDPSAVVDDTTPPPVVVTDVRVDNKSLDPSMLARPLDSADHLELSYGQRVISFEFAALSYRDPNQNVYRYKLDGFDADWTEVDASRRVATYTNLEPGSYVFHVLASNPDGAWSDRERSLMLTISPPWWAAWWFRAAVLLLGISAVATAYFWRERTLSSQRRKLERLVAERTRALEAALAARDVFVRTLAHDLKAPIVSLSWHAQALQRRLSQSEPDAHSLRGIAEAMAASADEAAASIDEMHDLTQLAAGANVPLHCEFLDLVALTRSAVGRQRDVCLHPLRFESSVSTLPVNVDRARLSRVLNNLLDNAAKYSPQTQPIEVRLGSDDREGKMWAIVRVRDHGIGIPAADLPHIFEQYRRGGNVGTVPGEGLGLASASQVVALHGGTFEVESKEGKGSTFTVRLPQAFPEQDLSSPPLRSRTPCDAQMTGTPSA